MKLFKAEDFASSQVETYHSLIADLANLKLNQWLDAAPTIYSDNAHAWLENENQISLKKAKLVCIEEIKKECENHIPTIKSKQVSLPNASDPFAAALVLGCEVVCLNCGKSLVAEWKVK